MLRQVIDFLKINLENTDQTWNNKFPFAIGQPLATDDAVIFPCQGSGIYVLDIESGNELMHISSKYGSKYSCGIDQNNLILGDTLNSNLFIAYEIK